MRGVGLGIGDCLVKAGVGGGIDRSSRKSQRVRVFKGEARRSVWPGKGRRVLEDVGKRPEVTPVGV